MSKEAITQEMVKKLFRYEGGVLYWIKSPRIGMRPGQIAGTLHSSNRYIIIINGRQYKRARVIFLYHKGYLPPIVDHRDLDTLNDRIENLRAASKSQNSKNRKASKGSSSKYLGVALNMGKYPVANIVINGKNKYLGSFKTEEEAAIAYNEMAAIHHGEFACLNIIGSPNQ